MTDVRKIFKKYFDEEELEDFLLWAFGPEYETIENGYQIITAWNELHYREYQLYYFNKTISADIPIILDLWETRE